MLENFELKSFKNSFKIYLVSHPALGEGVCIFSPSLYIYIYKLKKYLGSSGYILPIHIWLHFLNARVFVHICLQRMIFNGISTCVVWLYAEKLRSRVYYAFMSIIFVLLFLKSFFLFHTNTILNILNTNILHSFLEFRVFLSNTNSSMSSSNYFYLIKKNCLLSYMVSTN